MHPPAPATPTTRLVQLPVLQERPEAVNAASARKDSHLAQDPLDFGVDLTPDHPEPAATRVWFRFLRLQGRIRVSMTARLKDVGLSIPQCDVLTTLSEHEGVSQQELAAHLYVTKGNISGLVDRLEGAGLVERRPIPGDRRSYSLCLTPAGP